MVPPNQSKIIVSATEDFQSCPQSFKEKDIAFSWQNIRKALESELSLYSDVLGIRLADGT